MASIADCWHKKGPGGPRVRTSRYGLGQRWQVRYRDPSGASRNRSFGRRVDAERYVARIRSELLRGEHVDPAGARTLFRSYSKRWLDDQTFDESTREAVALRLRKHILPNERPVAWWGLRVAERLRG